MSRWQESGDNLLDQFDSQNETHRESAKAVRSAECETGSSKVAPLADTGSISRTGHPKGQKVYEETKLPRISKSPKKSVRQPVAAEYDGVQVRVHPIFSRHSPTKPRTRRHRDSGSLFVNQGSNGDSLTSTALSKEHRMSSPLPSSENVYNFPLSLNSTPPLSSLTRALPILECLRYCAHFHNIGYDERKLTPLSQTDLSVDAVLRLLRAAKGQCWVGAFLLQLSRVHDDQSENIVSVAQLDAGLARRMELMAPSFGCFSLQKRLREMRMQPSQDVMASTRSRSSCSSIPPPPPPLPTPQQKRIIHKPPPLPLPQLIQVIHRQHQQNRKFHPHGRKQGLFGKLFRKHKKSKAKSRGGESVTDASTEQPEESAPAFSSCASSTGSTSRLRTEPDIQTIDGDSQITEPRGDSSAKRDDDDVVIDEGVLFDNMCQFVSELVRTVTKPTLTQKISGWMTKDRPTHDQDSKLTTRRKQSPMKILSPNHQMQHPHQVQPMWNPVDGSTLTRLRPDQCCMLPSAHVPLLLAFESRPMTEVDVERIYRTKIKLVSIRMPPSSSDFRRSMVGNDHTFVVDGAVGGAVKGSGKSSNTIDDRSTWSEAAGAIAIENKRSWGPPSTMSLKVSQVTSGMDISSSIIQSRDASETIKCIDDVGLSWVDLSSMWGEVGGSSLTSSFRATVWPSDLTDQLGESSSLVGEYPELELQVTTEVQDVCDINGRPVSKRSLLFKHDENLLQEMFATHFIKSCGDILKSCGLDLCLLSFDCLPVGERHGFIEWVPGSMPLSEVCEPSRARDRTTSGIFSRYAPLQLTRTNPIQDYLRSVAYHPDYPYMIRKSVIDSFVKSCAGYCVITYILGVGDRHLDNLLLHHDGRLFHCDFSFIFGDDPKKYLPMRITENMALGMGGRDSDDFAKFTSLACAAFLVLRRPENVRFLLSLVRTLGGQLPSSPCEDDLNQNNAADRLEEGLQGVRDRFRLDLDDDAAMTYIETLIHDSLSSKMWMAVDAIHFLGKRF